MIWQLRKQQTNVPSETPRARRLRRNRRFRRLLGEQLETRLPLASVVTIIDDGTTGYSMAGPWTTASGHGGYLNDYQYNAAGTGADVATWTFSVTPGRYEVATTWYPYPNRATNAPFQIYDGATLVNSVPINQELAPNDFNDANTAWERLGGPYNITGNSLVVRLTDNANEYVIADAVRIERIGDLVLAPEIAVFDGATNLADGGTVNFGSTPPGVALDKTLTVRNQGTSNLTLTPINAGSLPAGYSLVSNFGSTSLAPNASTTFTVRLQSGTAQTYSGSMSFANDDSDENPFDLNLTGVVAVAPVVTVIDDGAAGYTAAGSWTTAAGYGGYQNDYQYSAAGSGADVATWTFNVSPGRYAVAATWVSHPNRATNSPFRIFDGGSLLNTVAINQEANPDDFTESSVNWERLGGPYDITGNSLIVRLADNANEYVIADAIRIERVGDLVLAPEIAVLDGATNVADGGTVNFGSTPPGVAVDKTLTVRNQGTSNLTLTPINAGSLPAGYSLVSNFGSTSLAPNASTTFTVRLQSGTAQTFSGALSFANNDSDENPFDLNLTGVVATAPVVTVIDDGAAGYTVAGSWTTAAGYGGYQNDYQYSAAGSGADVATWTFNVSPGRYAVAATWVSHPNRATNAPFRIFDGGSLLNTVAINQEANPDDFTESSVNWERLGGPYNITGNSLVVRLADNANEYVIADAIRIERVGDLVLAPEIAVLDGATNVADGGTVNFGSTPPGVAVDKTLTVRNQGTSNLTLTPINAGSLPAGYSLVSNFGSTSLAPNASTNFTVRLQSGTAQTYSGALSFANNDSDENPFDLNLTGIVAVAPVVTIIDDGAAGYTTAGSWTTAAGYGGYQNDYQYSAAGSGADVATWTFNVSPGRYAVAATWVSHPNRATNAPFRIFDGGSLLNTVAINQEANPDDFTESSVNWERLGGPYDITGNSLIVRLADNANEYVIADAIRIERVGDLVLAPEIAVLDGATNVADGGTVNFGSTPPGVAVDKTLTVRNQGTSNLTLTPINAGSLPAGYSLVSNFGSTSLAPNASTTFTVRLQSGTAQTYTGALSFANNDSDENPFDLNLTGIVAVAPVVSIIDDGAAGYTTAGSWTTATGYGGYQNDYQYSAAGSGADVATWTFNVSPGRYAVAATWVSHPNRATNAPFRIFDGGSLLNTVAINQEANPDDFTESSVNWERLGGPYDITGNSLVVRLADNANEYVIADAIRIERVGDLVLAPEIAVLDGATNVADGGTVNFGSTPPGVAVDKTLTVRNQGTSNLTLTPINAGSLPAGYSLVSNFGSTSLAPNASTTFTVRLQSGTAQTYSGSVSFANNDSDENPFDLNLTGVVAVAPVVTIIDDGAAGYTTAGSWTTAAGSGGYQNDYQYSTAGSGADVATWTFSVSPGRYDIATTWYPYPNRATNAPYRIFDGTTLLNTVPINQELSPNDFNDAGTAWERLGGPYNIAGNSLVIKLADNANEYVIADAVRIERVEAGEINVTPTSGLVTTENGGTASFSVVLGSQPTANVVIGLSVADNSEGSVAPSSLTFTPANWNQAQQVIVTGLDDLIDDGAISYLVVTSAATSADPKFNGVNPADVSVTNLDNGDQAGFTISPLTLNTTESGGQATFQVRLTSQPIAEVRLGISSSNTAEGTVAPSLLIFTPQNWNVLKTVTVTGVDDSVQDGPVQYSILTGPATSTDGKYQGLNPADPTVTNADNDTAGITASLVTANRTTEAGGTARLRVTLSSQPTANVTIPLASTDITEGTLSTSSLVFTPANWNTPQEVTVTGIDDPVDDGDVDYSVTIGPTSSNDPNYGGQTLPALALVNEDNDTAAVVLNPTSGIQAKEGGPNGSTAVRLASQPTASVTVNISINVPGQATLSTSTMTFTTGNWNLPQNVTITAIDDTDLDGNIPFVLTTTVTASADAGYVGLSAQATGTIIDNDGTPAILVRNLSHVTTESADVIFSTFYVKLNTQPTSNVTVPIAVSDATEGELRTAGGGPSASTFLIFTAANWELEQYVNIYGKDDNECDGDITYSITVGAATSGDPAYNGQTGSAVTVVNRDNEVCRFNGSYVGSYAGDDAGSVAFTVNQGAITVTAPLSGSGSVNNQGVVSFGVVYGEGVTCNFTGTMNTSVDGSANAAGTWVCPAAEMAGTWNATRTSTLFAAVPERENLIVERIAASDAEQLLTVAWSLWQTRPESARRGTLVEGTGLPDLIVVDLPGNQLGAAAGNTIYLDVDGAGHGWFIDPTPAESDEFELVSFDNELRARISSEAFERFDLLTVLAHEIGHLRGLPDLDPQSVDEVMAGWLSPGVRRLPW